MPTFNLEQFLIQNPAILFGLIIWTLIWKGLALWKSARQENKWWFVAILVLNTLGVLEILYIFIFSRKKIIKPQEEF